MWLVVLLCVYSMSVTLYIIYIHCLTVRGCIQNTVFLLGCTHGCLRKICNHLKNMRTHNEITPSNEDDINEKTTYNLVT